MENEIKKLREELDIIDDNIAKLLASRVETGKKIVGLKRIKGLPENDGMRENEIVERISKKNPEIAELLKELYKRIFDWVKNQ